MIGQGLSRNREELVLVSFPGCRTCVASVDFVSFITQIIPQGRGRNMAFTCIGISQPLGFSLGLILGCILVDRDGVRWSNSGFKY